MRAFCAALALSMALYSAAFENLPETLVAVERLGKFAGPVKVLPPPQNIVFVYFRPSDREPPAGYRKRLARVMLDIQKFYGSEMERHGLGKRSIQFELEPDGGLKVVDVKGAHPAAEYLGTDPRKGYGIRDEARPALKAAGVDENKTTVIYFCHLRTEQDGKVTGVGPYYGSGAQPGAFHWGRCWFTDATILDPDLLSEKSKLLDDEQYHRITVGRYNSIFIGGAAHELGHALGLPHDKERKDEAVRGTSLMGSGNRTYGEERRDDGKGSFLTLADALRLAAHPMFSGTTRELETKPQCKLEELKATQATGGKLEFSGRITATPEPYAIIVYNDSFGGGAVDAKGWHDYSSTTWTGPLDASNHFSIPVGEFKPGTSSLRVVVCHVNGATSTFRYPLTVGADKTPDAASLKF